MHKKHFFALLPCLLSIQAQAVNKVAVWEPLNAQFKHYQLKEPKTLKGLINQQQFASKSPYQLSFLKQTESSKIKHLRYQMYYKDVPIWGYHTLFHHYPNHKNMVTGFIIDGIEKDVASTNASLNEHEAWQKIYALTPKHTKRRIKTIEKIIYLKQKKARLAYLMAYFFSNEHELQRPTFIIDANTGELLTQWNNIDRVRIGQGPGGSTNPNSPIGPLTYSTGAPGVNIFGPFDVTINGANCRMTTADIQLRDFGNTAVPKSDAPFPITISEEGVGTNPGVFSYLCGGANTNANDNGTAPINTGQSPNNDSMFFAQQTLDMLRTTYNTANPISNDRPVRLYTHLGTYDNAFAVDTIRQNGLIISHQQLGIGNGNTIFTPLSRGVVAHEVGHLVTNNYSGMINAKTQSGGINEAFSDMMIIALYQYLRNQGYTWYWSGTDGSYVIGDESTLSGMPFRYLYNPGLDGKSIGSANDYKEGMGQHNSNGVFNRAYYLIATRYNRGPTGAFRLMFDANRNYWVPENTFAYGACGVIQAAYDRNQNYRQITYAFKRVGVTCKLFSPEKQVMQNRYS